MPWACANGLDVISRRDETRPASSGPVSVEELAARLVNALIGMGAEVIALRLQQVGGQTPGAIAVKEASAVENAGVGTPNSTA